jgi:hypothetical protein
MNLEEEVDLFKYNVEKSVPDIIKRFSIIRKLEKEMDADNSFIWKNAFFYYLQARNCYCCGFYYPAIQMISSCVELSFKKIYRDHFSTIQEPRRLVEWINFAYSNKLLSEDLKKRLDKLRAICRNPITHPKPGMSYMLGFEESKKGYWVLKEGQEMIYPEEAAKEGLICTLQLSMGIDKWIQDKLKIESTQSQ